MAPCPCVLLALLALCGLATASQNYSSLQPPQYIVTLTYQLNGVTVNPPPCSNLKTDLNCMPKVSVPDHDSVIVAYEGPPGAAGNTISLMTCFSNSSAVNRAWRKANPVISKDKKCNVASPFAKGLPTGKGSFKWIPGVNTPPASYNIQLLEVVNESNPTTYAAMGRSLGFFQIIPINDRPGWLMALVGVFCAIGPLTLAGFFTYEKVYKKD